MKCPSCQFENRKDAKFCNECGSSLSELAERQKIVSTFEGERKHATVLFSDFSGYTAMTERLDPEDVKEIMGEIFEKIEQVVSKYDGLVERFFGDEVMVLFGVPEAHEDDPVRAIRAGREIHHLVKDMSPEFEDRIGQPLAMHTGISTGLLVTGDKYIGKGRHGLTGDTINLAARLTKLAQADEILVGPDTYRQAEGYFTFESLEPTQVKGKEEPVQVCRVLSAKEKPSKIHRLHGLRAELIGRKAEMAQLAEAVEKLLRGESSIISICGDAGTGKSRLVEEFKATLDLKRIQWQEGHAYAYAQNISYFPLIDMMNRTWQIKEGDPPKTVKKKVESGVEYLIGKRADVTPYVGSLYAINYPEMEGVDAELWKGHLYRAIHEILSALSRRAPAVICMEDLHWADPSSLDLLRYILIEMRHPALFLWVYRPPFSFFPSHQRSILDKPYQEVRLKHLSPSEAWCMTASLLRAETIPSDLQRFVQEKAEGNPFYLEEVVNSLIETETLVRDNGTWKLTKSISESGISPTIHGVIASRLDRLEKATKRVLQEASVIGRTFLYEILKRITDLEQDIDKCLNGLEHLDLIRTRSLQPELEYIFKHALTQEVVYDGLLKKERQAIHERIGLVMEQLFQDRLSEFYEALAFQFKQGLSTFKAIDYLVKSGEKNVNRFALEESHEYFKDASDLLSTQTDRLEEEGFLIDLVTKWAFVFHKRGDFKGLLDLLAAHEHLAESLDDKARLSIFLQWWGVALFYRGKYRDSYQYLLRALRLGEATENRQAIGLVCSRLIPTCTELGFLEEALSFGERAQETARALPTDQGLASQPLMGRTFIHWDSLIGLGYVYWHRGDKKKALETTKALLDFGQKNSDFRCLGWGQFLMGLCHFLDGNFPSAIECCKKAIKISPDPLVVECTRLLLGALYAVIGEWEEAHDVLREVVTYSEKSGGEQIGTLAKLYLGATLIGQGRMGDGLEMIKEAQRSYLTNERRGLYALSEYILGKVYLQILQRAQPMSPLTIARNIGFLVKNVPFAGRKAETHFLKAIEIAEEIGAKGTLGQAYLDLGLLHMAKKRREKATECLAKAIQLFEQCEAEVFLKQAREALESLG